MPIRLRAVNLFHSKLFHPFLWKYPQDLIKSSEICLFFTTSVPHASPQQSPNVSAGMGQFQAITPLGPDSMEPDKTYVSPVEQQILFRIRVMDVPVLVLMNILQVPLRFIMVWHYMQFWRISSIAMERKSGHQTPSHFIMRNLPRRGEAQIACCSGQSCRPLQIESSCWSGNLLLFQNYDLWILECTASVFWLNDAQTNTIRPFELSKISVRRCSPIAHAWH